MQLVPAGWLLPMCNLISTDSIICGQTTTLAQGTIHWAPHRPQDNHHAFPHSARLGGEPGQVDPGFAFILGSEQTGIGMEPPDARQSCPCVSRGASSVPARPRPEIDGFSMKNRWQENSFACSSSALV